MGLTGWPIEAESGAETVVAAGANFAIQADAFRRELLVHCYQMLGSVHDAEDLVQETMLRAWRARERFDERRASLRTWLYRIATNACLNALASRRRRPLPSALGQSSEDPEQPLARAPEVPWLQPFPDALFGADDDDPAGLIAARERLRLALVAAWQQLPPRQRATLILCDVLDFSAAEVAVMLETTTAAVNSALQRARARLRTLSIVEEQLEEPTDAERRALLDRYVVAFEDADVAALQRLLTEDAVLEMPPLLNWFAGRELCGRFFARLFAEVGRDWRLLRTAANGQPACAAYARSEDGAYHARAIQVLSLTSGGIRRGVVFGDPNLFALFDLPLRLEADA
jgi:RNA polymerase sigma-70 factor (ECF subfamily)